MLNTHIYHQLPPTCFGVCYIIFRDATAILAQQHFKNCKKKKIEFLSKLRNGVPEDGVAKTETRRR